MRKLSSNVVKKILVEDITRGHESSKNNNKKVGFRHPLSIKPG
jgi:hypothetical protein